MSQQEQVEEARAEARMARLQSLVWWGQAAPVCGAYLAVSSQPWAERLILAYLSFVSIAAMGATYAGKAKAAEAKAAGYENPPADE